MTSQRSEKKLLADGVGIHIVLQVAIRQQSLSWAGLSFSLFQARREALAKKVLAA
jgi:hypothetical protein